MLKRVVILPNLRPDVLNGRWIRCFAAVVFSLSAIMGYTAETNFKGDIVDVVTIDTLASDEPYNKIWEPYIATWSEKPYLAAYGLQVTGKSDMGEVACSISRDSGKSWDHRIIVFDHRVRNGMVQYAYNNAVLFRQPGQDVIWMFVMRVPMHYRDSENADLIAA